MSTLLENNSSQNQEDLARQWIEFLRKRNTLLSVLWPLFLVLAVVAVIAAFYFQQSSLTTNVEKSLLIKENEDLLIQLDDKVKAAGVLEEEVLSLKGEISSLKDSLTLGVAEVKNGNEKAVFDAQMISNLESQVELLKTENFALTEALEENKALVELHKGTLAKKQGLKDDLLKENAELLSKLESRKIAYTALTKRLKEMQQEVDRLVSVNISQDRQLKQNKLLLSEQGKKSKQEAKNLAAISAELDKLKDENHQLSNKIQSILSPVGAGGNARTQPQKESVTATENPHAVVHKNSSSQPINSLVFEEIKAAPKNKELKPEKKAESTSFDYNKIEVP